MLGLARRGSERDMRWRVLGPLEVQAEDGWTGVDAPKRRALLAALLAEPGQIVSSARLIDELWRDDPPPAARKLISGYVLKLRRALGDPDGRVVVTRAPGYQLMTGRAEVDAGRFEELVSQGRSALAAGDADRAGGLLAAALALWRGPALADVPRGPIAAAEAGRLEEARLAAVELWAEAGLLHDQGTELVPELRRLTAVHPLRERFWHLLMRALARSGRHAEALAAYEQARQIIADELGADPGPDLQQLHQDILTGDQARPGRPGTGQPVASPSPAVVPRQLPGAARHFTGREAELEQLSELLGELSSTSGTVVVSAIGGTAGVGKTALAVHWAHQAAGQFPDGQLYVNLRGYDPGEPMPAAETLAAFLRALGVAGQDIPAGTGERAARYRSLLAGRRMLILLDNADSVQQVRPLLPGTGACVTVVTSRDSLAGLVARDGARRLELDLLPTADAETLLTTLTGRRAVADPTATAALAARCARLPLALRVAAEFVAARPYEPLSSLLAELAGQQPLDLLEAHGDPGTAVRAVFSWSYQSLAPGTARIFRLAGQHPGPGFDGYAAAALAGSTLGQAQHHLGLLVRAHLIQPTGPDQYAMHDLLRAYSRELAVSQDGEGERRAALIRLFDYCLHTSAGAMDTLYPAEADRRPRLSPATVTAPAVDDPAAAQRWLDAERARLVAMAAASRAHGWPRYTTDLAGILSRYLHTGGHCDEAIAVHTHALQAARDVGDPASETTALNCLAAIDVRRDMFPEAAESYRRALALCGRDCDPRSKATALYGLGNVHWAQGHYEPAAEYMQRAMDLFREFRYQAGEALTLSALGGIRMRQGDYRQATAYLTQSLSLSREMGYRTSEIYALGSLAAVKLRQGLYQQATDHYGQVHALCGEVSDRGGQAMALNGLGHVALRHGDCQRAASHFQGAQDLYRQVGDRAGQAVAYSGLGRIALRQSHYQQASGYFGQALTLYRQTGVRSGQAEALNGLGDVLLAVGQPGQARLQHSAGLDLAGKIGEKDQEAKAYDGLGRVARATGDLAEARRYWQRALAIYAELGAPEADELRHQLGQLVGLGGGQLPRSTSIARRSRVSSGAVLSVPGRRIRSWLSAVGQARSCGSSGHGSTPRTGMAWRVCWIRGCRRATRRPVKSLTRTASSASTGSIRAAGTLTSRMS
jgi:DNA-binding SARP family transcriptional activator/Tfp pilus assembly protein PilF